MDNLLDNNWLVPVLAASAFVVSLFDMVCLIAQIADHSLRLHHLDRQPKRTSIETGRLPMIERGYIKNSWSGHDAWDME